MTDKRFSFKIVTKYIVKKEIMNLGGSKATPNGDIFINIFKSTVDIHLPYITNIVSFSNEEIHFPNELKLAEVIPILKRKMT